jgi:hypothetical protein
MSDEWYSPSLIFDALGIEFDLDPCHPPYPTNVPCKKYFTIEDDGLKQSWGGIVWMNPPYSAPKLFVEKWLNHANGFALVPQSKSQWGLDLWQSEAKVVMMKPNLKFDRPNEKSAQIFMAINLWAIGEVAISVLEKSGLGKIR